MQSRYFLTAFLLLSIACKKDTQEQGSVQLNFQNVVNSQPLTLTATTYTNTFGETFNITAMKYYISNVSLLKMDNSEVKMPEAYYLVDESVAASKIIQLQAPAGEYRAIKFTVGVDSIRNVSGAQTGALDPVNGMFWSWNSGYIMAKLEGTSPTSTEPTKILQFHIGGYRKENSAIQEVQLITPISITVGSLRKPDLVIEADAYKWLGGPNPIRFSTTSTIHVPGVDAGKIAVNYKNMFRIVSVNDL